MERVDRGDRKGTCAHISRALFCVAVYSDGILINTTFCCLQTNVQLHLILRTNEDQPRLTKLFDDTVSVVLFELFLPHLPSFVRFGLVLLGFSFHERRSSFLFDFGSQFHIANHGTHTCTHYAACNTATRRASLHVAAGSHQLYYAAVGSAEATNRLLKTTIYINRTSISISISTVTESKPKP